MVLGLNLLRLMRALEYMFDDVCIAPYIRIFHRQDAVLKLAFRWSKILGLKAIIPLMLVIGKVSDVGFLILQNFKLVQSSHFFAILCFLKPRHA